MTEKRHAMPERITVEMRAEELPEILRARLKEPIPGMPYRVTVEALEDEGAKLEALRRDIDEGIRASEDGRTKEFDVERLIARLHRDSGRTPS